MFSTPISSTATLNNKEHNSVSGITKNNVIETHSQQKKVITGIVSDPDRIPLPGATILEKETTNGTVTNIDGEFSLSISHDADSLQFSFVGLKTLDVEIGSRTVFNIVLEEESVELEEFVAIGHRSQRKVSVLGSISSVKASELQVGGVSICFKCFSTKSGWISWNSAKWRA